jgi:hypothetical protein
MSEFRRTSGVPFLPGICRSRIFPGVLVLSQRLVYKEGVGSQNGRSLLWKFDFGSLRWSDHCGNYE